MIPTEFLVELSEWCAVNRCSFVMRFDNPLQIQFDINWDCGKGRTWGQSFAASVPELARLRNIDSKDNNWLAYALEGIANQFRTVRREFQTLMLAKVPQEVLQAVRAINVSTFRLRETNVDTPICIRGMNGNIIDLRIKANRLYYDDADLTDEIGKDFKNV